METVSAATKSILSRLNMLLSNEVYLEELTHTVQGDFEVLHSSLLLNKHLGLEGFIEVSLKKIEKINPANIVVIDYWSHDLSPVERSTVNNSNFFKSEIEEYKNSLQILKELNAPEKFLFDISTDFTPPIEPWMLTIPKGELVILARLIVRAGIFGMWRGRQAGIFGFLNKVFTTSRDKKSVKSFSGLYYSPDALDIASFEDTLIRICDEYSRIRKRSFTYPPKVLKAK